jgi:REP element-mobilizing transposase RayT
MVRPLRIEYPGAWYHVTSRGNENKKIFSDDHDKKRFLEILSTTRNLYGVEVHAYVLMDNHFHLVLMTSEANLSSFMQRFNTTYTIYYNRRHKRRGHLYQGRYKAILIEEDSYLLELSRYVHLNPVRIKRFSSSDIKEKRKIIRTYRWSSYNGYVHLKNRETLVNYSKILGMIGGKDDKERGRRYERFVIAGVLKDMNMTFWEDVKGQAVLGSEGFTDWVYENFFLECNIDKRELSGIKDLKTGPNTTEEIAKVVACEFGVTQEELYQRRAPCRDGRLIFLELCRIYLSRKMTLAEIGRELGDISASAFSRNKLRIAEKIEKDPFLKKRFEILKNIWNDGI